MAELSSDVNLRSLRDYLNRMFDDAEFNAFCLDHFSKVFDKFSGGMRKDEKITLLLDYCRRDSRRYQKLITLIPEAQMPEKGSFDMASDKENRTVNVSSSDRVQGIISGGDVNIENSIITIGDQATVVNKQKPSFGELKQLLTEIHEELAEITTQKEALNTVSSKTPDMAQDAEKHVKSAAEKIEPEMQPDKAKSVQNSLAEATSLLTGVLDGARTVAQKAGEVGSAVMPIVGKLELLVKKLEVAVIWIAKLWPWG